MAFVWPAQPLVRTDKYNIEELVDFNKSGIHPLGLVIRAQSFQNTESIERVFSNFVERSFWGSVLEVQARLPDKPDDVYSCSPALLAALRKTFELRHELVHDPRDGFQITEGMVTALQETTMLILGADLVLTSAMERHRDPDLAKEQEEEAFREAAKGAKHQA